MVGLKKWFELEMMDVVVGLAEQLEWELMEVVGLKKHVE